MNFENDLQALEASATELWKVEKWMRDFNFTPHDPDFRTRRDEYAEKAHRAEFLKVLVAILTDNARRALFNDVLPVALEIVAKYAGKPYGEKTQEKIRKAVEDKTKCSFYIRDKYNAGSMHFCPSEIGLYCRTNMFFGRDLNISAEYDQEKREFPRFLINNKIQPIDAGKLHLDNCPDYVDDPEARAHEIMQKFSAMRDAVTAAERACNDLNAVLPSKMKHHSISGFDRYLF